MFGGISLGTQRTYQQIIGILTLPFINFHYLIIDFGSLVISCVCVWTREGNLECNSNSWTKILLFV